MDESTGAVALASLKDELVQVRSAYCYELVGHLLVTSLLRAAHETIIQLAPSGAHEPCWMDSVLLVACSMHA